MVRFITLFLAVVFFFTGESFAQSGREAVVNAIKYRPMPSGATLEIQALDNSDSNLALVSILSQAMQAKGYLLADKGTLVMTIETRDEIGAWSTSGDGNTIEFKTLQGSSGTDESELRVNLFDSSSGGLLSNSQSSPTSIVTPTQYVIDATVDSREDGKRLWEGWIASELGQSDSRVLLEKMAPALADVYGQSIKNKIIALP